MMHFVLFLHLIFLSIQSAIRGNTGDFFFSEIRVRLISNFVHRRCWENELVPIILDCCCWTSTVCHIQHSDANLLFVSHDNYNLSQIECSKTNRFTRCIYFKICLSCHEEKKHTLKWGLIVFLKAPSPGAACPPFST